MQFNELLPIGSVIRLHNGKKRLMIFGVGQTNEEDGKTYDYVGVPYPEGSLGAGTQFLFNHHDIEEISFRGFEDEERENFIQSIQMIYDQAEQQDKNTP